MAWWVSVQTEALYLLKSMMAENIYGKWRKRDTGRKYIMQNRSELQDQSGKRCPALTHLCVYPTSKNKKI